MIGHPCVAARAFVFVPIALYVSVINILKASAKHYLSTDFKGSTACEKFMLLYV